MCDPYKYTVGWICALPLEFTAAKAFLEEKHEDPHAVARHDDNNYALGRIGTHNVVIAVLPDGEYGTTSAANVARNMLHSFPNVRIGLMVGIGGGAPSSTHDVRLGDVVVSHGERGRGGVFQYDFGKTTQSQIVSFEHTGFLNQPPTVLRTAVSALQSQYEMEGHQLNARINKALEDYPRIRNKYSRPSIDSDRLYRSDVVHPDSGECENVCGDSPDQLVHRRAREDYEDDPFIHYGLIASANQLMKNAAIRDKLASDHGVICFEMEAAGLMNHFPCIVVRGICDYSDSHKNQRWQEFAAIRAAAYASDLLRQIHATRVDSEDRIVDVLGPMLNNIKCIDKDVKHVRNELAAIRDDQLFEKARKWLAPPDISSNIAAARKQRHGTTGAWFLRSDTMNDWILEKRHHLWLRGLAGCGKTVLSTTIFDHLQELGIHPTLIFFFDFKDNQKRSLENLLCSLAWQMYHIGDKARQVLDNDRVLCPVEGRPTLCYLSSCVYDMLGCYHRVRVIIDALDECTTKRDLLSWMEELVSSPCSANSQLIVTGRPEVDFVQSLPRFLGEDNCIKFDTTEVNADIHSYVSAQLENPGFKVKGISPNLLNEIRDKVGRRADGMFRWASCQMDNLALCLSARAIRTALRNLPRDLNETYSRMIESIPAEIKFDGIRLLQFLVYCERPLTVAAAMDVIATRIDTENPFFDVEGRLYEDHYLLRFCPGLILIGEDSTRRMSAKGEKHRKIVQLAHFSVKEYLQIRHEFELPVAGLSLAKTCLVYLEQALENLSLKVMKAERPLAVDAVHMLVEYSKFAEPHKSFLRKMLSFLRQERMFYQFCCLAWPENHRYYAPSSLYFACYAGLPRAATWLVEDGMDVNTVNSVRRSCLDAASAHDNVDIIRLLISRGADVNSNSPIQTAVRSGHAEVVRALVEGGADFNAKDEKGSSPLLEAARRGYEGVVRVLIKSGAVINKPCDDVDGLLHEAAKGGHARVVRVLIENGLDVNARNKDGHSPLHSAVRHGHQVVVRILIENGADVNASDIYKSIALEEASQKGHLEIVEFLLGAGARIHGEKGNPRGFVNSISLSKNEDIHKLLIEKGLYFGSERGDVWEVERHLGYVADIDPDGSSVWYNEAVRVATEKGHKQIIRLFQLRRLFQASAKGHVNIVRALLDEGVSVEARDTVGCYESALEAAAFGNHRDVVELLLENGACVKQDNKWLIGYLERFYDIRESKAIT